MWFNYKCFVGRQERYDKHYQLSVKWIFKKCLIDKVGDLFYLGADILSIW